jgi:hypothetical protein
MKNIEKAAEEYALKTGYHGDKETFIAGVKWAQQWISVDDEVPNEKCKVLVKLLDNSIFTDFWFGYWFTFGENVTHWRSTELE